MADQADTGVGDLTDEEARQLAQHVNETQIAPQVRARQLRDEGHDVRTAFVSTAAGAAGETIICVLCARSATLPPGVTLPPGKKPVCPRCLRR